MMVKPCLRSIACGLAAALILAGTPPVRADSSSSFSDTEKRLIEKAAEVKTLRDQLDLLEATIDAKAAYLAELDAKVEKAKRQLVEINGELATMQTYRREAERTLSRYMRAAYVNQGQGRLVMLTGETSLSEAFADQSYLGSLQEYADRVVGKLAAVETDIAARQAAARESYHTLDTLDGESQRETAQLAAVRETKQRLLAATQGQESTYRAQFEEAKQVLKKTGRFARSARDRVASRVWNDQGFYFNQLDSRWIDAKLGFSDSSTMGDYGCGVTALAMVFKYYGLTTTPPQLNEELKRSRAFTDDLLDWRTVAAASNGRLKLANNPYPLGAAQVDWTLINRQLDSGNPVIVYIDRGDEISHYVALISRQGDIYYMHDPIEGPNLVFGDHYQPSAVYQFITFQRT